MPLQNTIIVVNEEPYCIWEVDLENRNLEFIEGIDVEYFEYLLNLHLDAEDEKRASIALRATLHHATETLFSLMGAYIQAPDCAYAWVAKCKTEELRALLRKIKNGDASIFTKFNLDQVSWKSISELIFQSYLPNTPRADSTKKMFSKCWDRLARDFLDEKNIDEYNSLKHGFRVRSGGFSLAFGLEYEYGVSPPTEEMESIGGSEYGTKFIRMEHVGGKRSNRNLLSKSISLNWHVEAVALQLQLVCVSINNVISALKVANGIEAGKCKFLRPIEDGDFDKPWSYSVGVPYCSMDFVIDETKIAPISKDELNNLVKSDLLRVKNK